jgi:hypothetical protein
LRRILALSASFLTLSSFLGCGSSSSNVSGVKNRAFVADNFNKAIELVDESNDQVVTTVSSTTLFSTTEMIALTSSSALGSVPVSPVSLIEAGSGSTGVTIAVTHDTFNDGISIVSNTQETQTSAVSVTGQIYSAVVTSDAKTVFAASPDANAVYVIDIASATVTATLNLSNVRKLVISPDNSKVLAFSADRNFFTVIKVADNTTQQVAIPYLSADNGVFSSDSTKAYVLNCGPECGDSSPASVQLFDLSGSTPAPGTLVNVPGATVGALDSSGNLYVAGSPNAGPMQGVVTALNTSLTIIKTAAIGDGLHTLMVLHPNGKFYIGAQTCTDQTSIPNSGCLSVFNPSSGSVLVDSARGDVTGIQPVNVNNRNKIYITEGGKMVIYDGTTDQPQALQVAITGRLVDVKTAQ